LAVSGNVLWDYLAVTGNVLRAYLAASGNVLRDYLAVSGNVLRLELLQSMHYAVVIAESTHNLWHADEE